MNNDLYLNLDNPVWHSLTSTHSPYALGGDFVKRYPVDMLRILGCKTPLTADLEQIEPWVVPGENFFVVGELPALPKNWVLHSKLECVQMVCSKLNTLDTKNVADIEQLTEDHRSDMLELIGLVQPGYFFHNTPLLGNYFGIIKNNKLVAMAGERLKMTGFTEISAVVTHPDHTGQGYAQNLVAHVSKKNIEQNAVPFLHFVNNNVRARRVYELLGYTERKTINFWLIEFKGQKLSE